MEQENFEISPARVKQEPPVEFVLILPRPTFGWPAVKQEKDVKPKRIPTVKLRKFDAKWRGETKLYQTFCTCLHCQFVVKYEAHLTQHLSGCRKIKPARFECDSCGGKFQNKKLMRAHMWKHSSEKRFCCTKCGHGFTNKSDLLRHWRAKTIYKCEACEVKFSCKLLLDHHQREFHNRQLQGAHKKSFTCQTCRKDFCINQSLQAHQMQHRHGIFATAPEETFDCDKCDKTFSSPKYLQQHQRVMHNEKEFKCEVCEKTFKNKHSLCQHRQTHNKVECSICHKMFSKYKMSSHVRTHSAENHFKCDICDHSNNTKSNLKTHIETKHLLKKLENDSKCREDFSELELLEELLLKHGSSATSGGKKFKCDKCPKAFVTPNKLNEHKRTVHTKKSFECAICKKAFKTKSHLKCHRARVHSKK